MIWEAPDVLKVPTSALFREGEKWAVYVVENGRARRDDRRARTPDRPGGRESLSGLSEGARVILHPGDTLADGARVSERS